MRSPLDEVIQEIAQDAHLSRIKKLLLYASRRVWESHPSKLQQIDLYPLVQTLQQTCPTQEHLRTRLAALVKTLSKPAEYTLIANLILHYMAPLYPEDAAVQMATLADYEQVAQALEQDPERDRIKKLLFSACTQTWENDPAVLAQNTFLELVQKLHQLTATRQTLDTVLRSIVQTLNRQTEYTIVSQRILKAFSRLYAQEGVRETSEHDPAQLDQTHIVAYPNSRETNELEAPATDRVATAGEEATQPSLEKAKAEPASPTPESSVPPERSLNLLQLYDLRLHVITHANPLRTKQLLLAWQHYPILPQAIDPQALKAHSLDTLLQQLLESSVSLSELEQQLYIVALTFPEPESYQQVVTALYRGLKLFSQADAGAHYERS